ncbi:TPA: hypothetical protein QDB15_000035 [Burkholderia vietnamiensis]|uniref:Uncharacterized protein n=1 Tax=Pandoraea apista TaxID=93218 RepID=A0A5E5P1I2_9BURK|nr:MULTISPECIES: hypothetical protein [Burkholderiaceae]MCA8206309.1 hypothetical protein [Burkholderia vietnamiensis]VVG70421.1 hypothetical protein PAP18089_01381 [Pandoraea apista]HDR8943107.1 hypothetical protein [Burkholderia vietnamiensis]HDR9116311.1 hypothetical protein [Burkholderia vietnamiensis]HDR9205357.1 hypothetical protein [Burkholderia vietnamiensis]
MSTITTRTTSTPNSKTAAFPRTPEAHQRTAVEGDTKEVVLNGARILMRFTDGRWWNVRVSNA